MNGVGDQLFAGARFAAYQYRCVGVGHLRDGFVHLSHRPAIAYDVGKVILLFQLLTQVYIFVKQALAFGLYDALGFKRLGDHRGDDAHEFHLAVIIAVFSKIDIHAEGADRFAFQKDGDADKGHLAFERLFATGKGFGKQRLVTDLRNHYVTATVDDPRIDGFSQKQSRLLIRCSKAAHSFKMSLAVLFTAQRDGAEDRPVGFLHQLEHTYEPGF